jgi:hypothetical protein
MGPDPHIKAVPVHPEQTVPISSPLSNSARLTKTQLNSFLGELKNEPKNVQQAQLNELLQAGEARLPDGAAKELRDQLFALANDTFDPAQGAPKRPAMPAVKELAIQRQKSMDGARVDNNIHLIGEGSAPKGSTVEFFNASRPNDPVVGSVTVGDNGKWSADLQNNNFFFGDKIGVRVRDPNSGHVSETNVTDPKTTEQRVWQSGTTRRKEVVELDTQAPMLNQGNIPQTHIAPTPTDKTRHMALAGKAGSTEPFATLEMVIDGEAQRTKAAADGSFFFDVKGVKAGQTYQLRAIDDAGQVRTLNFKSPAMKFDSQALLAGSAGVPYDRMVDGKPHKDGPFMRFAAEGVAEPHAEITLRNNTTGKEVSCKADANGNVDLELAGVHVGDSLSLVAQDLAGQQAPGLVENFVVPGEGSENIRLTELLCSTTLLKDNVDEMIQLLKAEPSSTHRAAVQEFLDDGAGAIQNAADKTRLGKALTAAFSGRNDIVSNATNPEPKDPIVIGARVIKPRVMDRGNAAGRDPLEVEGRAEPFATVEIRNASQPNAPVIGTVQADKDGKFDFLSTDERLFLHGDQLLVRARDQGGAASGDTLAHTCAYELRIWNATNRTETVELPHETDTRNPFIDAGKIEAQARLPIAKNGDEQVYQFKGGALSAEPNSVVRVTNKAGDTYEAKVKQDGSFDLKVGTLTPGETLRAQFFDVNGRSINHNLRTQALKFDSDAILSSSMGVPYQQFTAGKASAKGPFLDFKADAAVDPHSWIEVKNNSTGQSFKTQADEHGNVDLQVRGVHAGDSLAFTVTDPAGNVAPGAIENYVVPSEAAVNAAVENVECQHVFLKEHIDELSDIVTKEPTAAHRAVLESIFERKDAFQDPAQHKRLGDFIKSCFTGANDVQVHAENPAPKQPIVIDADIIKPRVMDARPANRAPPRDPLLVQGKAEPFSTVEIRNASQPNAPVIGTVQTDKDGNFDFQSTDERLFLHGDQILVRAVDQGGAASTDKLETTCQYEMQVWHNPPRTETVKLAADHDTRNPFLDASKMTAEPVPAKKSMDEQIWRMNGAALASEPNAIVRVTNKAGNVFEAQVKPDGTFKLDVPYEPGETLRAQVFDINGRAINHNMRTPALKFDPQAFVNSSEGAPYTRPAPTTDQDQDGPSRLGPFLRFAQEGAVDPFSTVTIKNNSTGAEFKAQADANGNLDLEIDGVHVGDSLKLSVQDPAGNAAPQALANWVVPAEPNALPRIQDITCQRTVQKEHADELIQLLKDNPTAANRAVVEHWLNDDHQHTAFQTPADKGRIDKAMQQIFAGANDVRSELNNPAPKAPIVIDAKVIKPRVMDQGSAAGRDPLEVSGEAEPFSTIEIRNASQPGSPVIGTVQTDEHGQFDFLSTDERLFLHGDQLLVRAVDQGGGASKNTLTETCAYELQIWNRTNRTETVRLPDSTDTRNPFLDMGKVQQEQTLGVKGKPKTHTSIAGGPGSAEPNSIVHIETSKGNICEAKVAADGSFNLDVGGYVPGETLRATITDVSGRAISQNFKTEALPFDHGKLTADVQGPPYQKLNSAGKQVKGGPFLEFNAAGVSFPGAQLEVTNHATGKSKTFTADKEGGFNFELGGVHAFDLLSFKLTDAEGNAAPQALRGWQTPAVSSGAVDPTIQALTCQRPVSEQAVDHLVQALEANPTQHHRQLCETLMHENPDWFLGDGLDKLKEAIGRIFCGPPERIPDATNPRPQMPVVLGAEIVKPRVMDRGNLPQDPLNVNGLGEPLSTIEIYNGSAPGRPLIGSVQVGEDGKWDFTSTDESKFLHGDQVVVMAKDAGGATSDSMVSRGTAFELRVWNSTGRREKVALGKSHDTRDPFMQTNLLATERAGGTQQDNDNLVLVGQPGATETFGKVSVTIGDETFETEADLNGGFKLPVPGAKAGENITIIAMDPNGRSKKVNYKPQL